MIARCVVRSAWCVGTAVLLSAPVRAQQFRADVLAQPVEHRVLYQGTVFRQTGTWLGLRGEVTLRRVRFEISTIAGGLGGDADSANPDRDTRTTMVAARWRPNAWLEVGPAAEARRFVTGGTATTWRMFGVSGRAETDLGLPMLRGTAELTVFPLASGTHAVAPSSAVRAGVGLELTPVGSPFLLRVAYRFERFTMEDPVAAGRREQFDAIQIGGGVRLTK